MGTPRDPRLGRASPSLGPWAPGSVTCCWLPGLQGGPSQGEAGEEGTLPPSVCQKWGLDGGFNDACAPDQLRGVVAEGPQATRKDQDLMPLPPPPLPFFWSIPRMGSASHSPPSGLRGGPSSVPLWQSPHGASPEVVGAAPPPRHSQTRPLKSNEAQVAPREPGSLLAAAPTSRPGAANDNQRLGGEIPLGCQGCGRQVGSRARASSVQPGLAAATPTAGTRETRECFCISGGSLRR